MPQMTANQALYNSAVRHQVHVLRFSEGQAAKAKAYLDSTEQELLAEIIAAMSKGLDASRSEALLASIKTLRAQVYQSLGEELDATLTDFAATEAGWETGALQGSVPISLNLAAVPAETLAAVVKAPIAGIPLTGWLENIAASEAQGLQRAITLGVLQGETIDQMVARVRGTKANNFEDGVLSVSRRNAQALVRTAVNHTSNAAREEVWNANDDIVEALRWTSTLDGRTSTICAGRDGQLTPLGDRQLPPGSKLLVPAGARPPAHFNCRSLLVAVLDGIAIAGDRPFVADARTRAEREKAFRKEAKERGVPIQQVRQEWAEANVGRLPAATTYQEWLKTQPKAFQDEVLGAGKAELFRQGLPLERFVDSSGKQLSLEALKAEVQGDLLNVLQPAIGIKAKGLLMGGLSPEDTLKAIHQEFPDAKTSMASLASYKSELNKAGLLPAASNNPLPTTPMPPAAALKVFEGKLPPAMKENLAEQWASVTGSMEGSPGAYAYYKPGKGVMLSAEKLGAVPANQQQAIIGHELGHLLHKEHDILPADIKSAMAKFQEMPDQLKKLYSYYGAHPDELWGEIVGQAMVDGPLTSQGISAGPFKTIFKDEIEDAKAKLAATFKPKPVPEVAPGLPIPGSGGVPGKPTSIGSYAKTLLMQGMDDEAVLAAVKVEFPNAKTGMNSIKSYKSELKKSQVDAVGKSGPTIAVTPSPAISTPTAPSPVGLGTAEPIDALDGSAIKLSGLTKTGAKMGGSNPGAVYTDTLGEKYLVKGNLQKVNNKVTAAVSDDRARNEVLAARLIQEVDKGLAPTMKLVDLEGQYGGGLGVASKLVDGVEKFNVNNAAHIAAAQKDFALHAWLGNYDVVGASFDNLVMKAGKAVNIDPGGALLFRAQGLPKTDFSGVADTWDSMRNAAKNAQAGKVYGGMTTAQLKSSAMRLFAFSDDKIAALVDEFGPIGATGVDKAQLKNILMARRDDIFKRAGVTPPWKLTTPAVSAPELSPSVKKLVDDLIALNMDDAAIAAKVKAQFGFAVENGNGKWGLLTQDQVAAYKAVAKAEGPLTEAQMTVGKVFKPVPQTAAVQAMNYKKMTGGQLASQLLAGAPDITTSMGAYTQSAKLKVAMAELFKTGASTDKVLEALAIKYPTIKLPTKGSAASIKVQLKKAGLLEGGPVPFSAPEAMTPPKLANVPLGSKSSGIKEQMKALIQQGGSPDQALDIALKGFSTPNMQGASDLYELAMWEVKSGKLATPTASAVQTAQAAVKKADLKLTPLRPATTPREGFPPPPRFSQTDRRAAVNYYAKRIDTTGLSAVNTAQKSAGLELLTDEEFAAVRAYTGSIYRTINAALRDGKYASDMVLQAYVDAAQSGLRKLPKHVGVTHRGTTISSTLLDDIRKRYVVGGVVEENSFLSTSYGDSAAFGGNVRFHIDGKTGVNVSANSYYKGEREVLFMPGTKHKVQKVDVNKDGTLDIFLEELK